MLLIVAHTPSPNLERLGAAIEAGASAEMDAPSNVRRLSPFETTPDDVKRAAGIILMTPENLGYMSGALKDFFDRVYYPCLEETQGLAMGVLIRAGHDGRGTRRAIVTITTGLRWRAVAPFVVCKGPFDEAFIDEARTLGETMGAGTALGIF